MTGDVIDFNADQRFVRQDAALGALADMAFGLALAAGASVAQHHCLRLYRTGLITYAELEEIWDRVEVRLIGRRHLNAPRPDDRDELCFTINGLDGPDAA